MAGAVQRLEVVTPDVVNGVARAQPGAGVDAGMSSGCGRADREAGREGHRSAGVDPRCGLLLASNRSEARSRRWVRVAGKLLLEVDATR